MSLPVRGVGSQSTFQLGTRMKAWTTLVLAISCSACAHVYVDEEGKTNVIGFAWVTVTPSSEYAGQLVRTRTLGVALTRAELESAIAVGYQDTTLAYLRNHTLVRAEEIRRPGEAPEGARHAASQK